MSNLSEGRTAPGPRLTVKCRIYEQTVTPAVHSLSALGAVIKALRAWLSSLNGGITVNELTGLRRGGAEAQCDHLG